MPRHPSVARSVAEIAGSVYSSLSHRIAEFPGEVYPFHVGDTWLEPADGCRLEDLTVEQHPGMHRYAPPQGMPELLKGICRRTETRTACPTAPEDVLVAAGATGALGAVMGAILNEGDEVLILAPYWPLIPGIVTSFHGRPVPVPILDLADDPTSILRAAETRFGPNTVALYLSTPNNPTGQVLPESTVRALVDWAVRRELWIVADEVYEDYVYKDRHVYARPLAPDRTFSAHSFSKAFGMAGNRCGYVVGPRHVMPELTKVSTHAFYSTPTASQLAAIRALDGRGDRWVDGVRPRYRELGESAARKLGLPAPEGSTFLFMDVADRLDERGLLGFLERCADSGIFLAPGPSFGPYPTHVRLCFTATEPERFRRGVEKLAELL